MKGYVVVTLTNRPELQRHDCTGMVGNVDGAGLHT